jgi:hypothetical protein
MKHYSTAELKPFFLKLTQLCFGELGLKDCRIIEYITFVLTNFSRTENLYRIRNLSGKQLKSVVEMLLESNVLPPKESRSSLFREMEMYQHIGDYTLFMMGIFKEHVEKMGCIDFYLLEGKKSYGKVADIKGKLYEAGEMLFRELSYHFEFYTGALNFMKKTYFAKEVTNDPFENFLKHLEHKIWNAN